MKLKIYIILLFFLKSYSQTQNINYGNINFDLPTKYQIIDKDFLKTASDSISKENKKLGEKLKEINLDYNERTTFSYRNSSCNCLNSFVLSQTKIGFPFSNSDYSSNAELQNEIKKMYDETIESNKEQVNALGIAKITKINPTIFTKNENINYFHISSEIVMLKNNKTIVADIFIIPVEDFFYQLEFSTDKKNYGTIKPLINQIVSSIKINH